MKSDMVLVHRQHLLDLEIDDFFELLTLAIAQYPLPCQLQISLRHSGPPWEKPVSVRRRYRKSRQINP